jgi:hypothetical protein
MAKVSIGWIMQGTYLFLLGLVLILTLFLTLYDLHNWVIAYLVSGLLTYVANPAYWITGTAPWRKQTREVYVIFIWPFIYIFYLSVWITAGVIIFRRK